MIARHSDTTPEREVLWLLWRQGSPPVRATVIALPDAVELEVQFGEAAEGRWRFVRVAAALGHAAKLRQQLEDDGFRDRRATSRLSPARLQAIDSHRH